MLSTVLSRKDGNDLTARATSVRAMANSRTLPLDVDDSHDTALGSIGGAPLRGRAVAFGLWLALVSGWAPPSSAADSSWRAVMELAQGAYRNCGDTLPNYKIAITGNRLVGTPEQGESKVSPTFNLDVSTLMADGSGKAQLISRRGITWVFEFEAGAGPRRIRLYSQNAECRYLLVPR
jgi:hypothetical protein